MKKSISRAMTQGLESLYEAAKLSGGAYCATGSPNCSCAGCRRFAAFCAATSTDWDRMAMALYRRWELPPGVAVEDLRQELLMEVWTALPKWDAARRPLDEYIAWNANAAARKWLNRQRAAYRRDGRASSRFALAASSVAPPGRDESAEGADVLTRASEGVWGRDSEDAEARVCFRGALRRLLSDAENGGDSALSRSEAIAVRLFVEEAIAERAGRRRRRRESIEERAGALLPADVRFWNRLSGPDAEAAFVSRAVDKASAIVCAA